MLATEYPVTTF